MGIFRVGCMECISPMLLGGKVGEFRASWLCVFLVFGKQTAGLGTPRDLASLLWVWLLRIQVELLNCKHISYTRPGKGTWSCTHVKASGLRAS